MAIFPTFFLGNIGQENVFYDILEQKKAFLGYRNKKFKKSKNWRFSKGGKPWFWSKNGHISKVFFFRQYRPGKCFLRYFTTKNSFLGYKNKKLKKSKYWFFLHRCWSRNDHYFNLFFKQNRKGKCLLRYFTTMKLLSRL